MTPTATASIVFAGAFGGALLGMVLGRVVPAHHLSEAAQDTVKLGAGVIATMAALILGLLVSSASGSLERMADELLQIAGKVILLDRALANYGPETREVRDTIKKIYTTELAQLFSGDEAEQAKLTTPEALAKTESIPAKLRALVPQSDAQRLVQAQALQIAGEVSAERWLLLFQRSSAIPVALLVALVMWLGAIFAFFGLFAPRNPTVIAVLFVCALSVSSAVFLIEEMNSPFNGWITVSAVPLQEALVHLGE
jgi:hypothetical protein